MGLSTRILASGVAGLLVLQLGLAAPRALRGEGFAFAALASGRVESRDLASSADDPFGAILEATSRVVPRSAALLLATPEGEAPHVFYRASAYLYPRPVWRLAAAADPEQGTLALPRTRQALAQLLEAHPARFALVLGVPPRDLEWADEARTFWIDRARALYLVRLGPP